MELIWVALGQVVLPILIGLLFLAQVPRWPRLFTHPTATAIGLYLVLVVLTALAAPGGDMWMPLVGAIVSVPVAVAVMLTLRKRRTA